jgi:hypothetical protein
MRRTHREAGKKSNRPLETVLPLEIFYEAIASASASFTRTSPWSTVLLRAGWQVAVTDNYSRCLQIRQSKEGGVQHQFLRAQRQKVELFKSAAQSAAQLDFLGNENAKNP